MEARRRPLGLLFALLAVLVLAFVATGCKEKEKTSGAEGEFIKAGDALYQVQLSRLLNVYQRPDNDYLRGQPVLPADQQYVGVFLTVENDGKRAYLPPRDMKVVDTQGNQYLPTDVSATGFGLSFAKPILPKQTAPPPDSPAATGQEGGALVLFRMSEVSVTENLPLDLKIPVRAGKEANVRLDL